MSTVQVDFLQGRMAMVIRVIRRLGRVLGWSFPACLTPLVRVRAILARSAWLPASAGGHGTGRHGKESAPCRDSRRVVRQVGRQPALDILDRHALALRVRLE